MESKLVKRSSSAVQKFYRALPLALGLMSMTAMQPALAQEEARVRSITVTGNGMEYVQTSLTQVQLGVEAQGREAQDVQQEVARRSTAVVDFLRSRNVQRLQTTGINLNPVYSYENNRQRLTGYTASNVVSFQIPTDRIGNLLDEAVRVGASRIDGVSFIASDEALSQARQVALSEATQDARDQANAVLRALGLNPGEVVSIQVNGATPMPPPMPVAYRAAAVAQDASTPVVGGEQQIQASVTLQIRY